MKPSVIPKSNSSSKHIKWKVFTILLFLWALLIIPLSFAEYFYFKSEFYRRLSSERTFQEDILSQIFEQRARYGDLINTKGNIETLGKAFGLKKVLVCQNGYEIFGSLTELKCPSDPGHYKLKVLNQNLDLYYVWDNPLKEVTHLILGTIIVSSVLGFILFLFVGGVVYFVLVKKINQLSKDIAGMSVEDSTSNLTSQLPELSPIVNSIYQMKTRIDEDNKNLNRLKTSEALGLLAKQVAHDIRSPLSALKLITKSNGFNTLENSKLVLTAISRIEGIATDLLRDRMNQLLVAEINLKDFLQNLIEIKSAEYIQLETVITYKLTDQLSANPILCLPLSEDKLFRILSNLINNSVEALTKSRVNREIAISCALDHSSLALTVLDHGTGIKSDVVQKLLHEGGSFGKSTVSGSGHGLGLSYIKSEFQRFGGEISISSTPDVGTEITIKIPIIKNS